MTKRVLFILFLEICFQYWRPIIAQTALKMEVLTTETGLPTREIKQIIQDSQGFMWFGTTQGIIRYDGYRYKVYDSKAGNTLHIPAERVTGSMIFQSPDLLWFEADNELFELNVKTNQVKSLSEFYNLEGPVRALYKSKDDTIAIVTDDGLNLEQLLLIFDGEKFQIIAKEPRGIREFTELTSDNNGNLWWSTFLGGTKQYNIKGDLQYEAKFGSFQWFGEAMFTTVSFFDNKDRHYVLPMEPKGVFETNAQGDLSPLIELPETVNHALEDQAGRLWFAGRDQLLVYFDGENQFFSQRLHSLLDYSVINDLFLDHNGLLWIATDGGIVKIQIAIQPFQQLFTSGTEGWGNAMRSMFSTPDGRLFAMNESENSLYVLMPDGRELEFPVQGITDRSDPLASARQFVLSKDSRFAYTVNHTLLRVDLNNGEMIQYPEAEQYLSVTNANPLLKLKDDRLLLGHSLATLVLFDPVTEKFDPVFKEISGDEFKGIRVMLESKESGEVWLGSLNSGLLKISLSGKVLNHITSDTEPALNKEKVNALYEDVEGGLWVGTFGGGVNYLPSNAHDFEIFDRSSGLANENIVAILPDHKGHIWIATYNGICSLDLSNKMVRNYFTGDGLSHNEFNVFSHYKDASGALYFGGMNGINKFYPDEILAENEAPPMELVNVNINNGNKERLVLLDEESEGIRIKSNDLYFTINWSLPSYFTNQRNSYYTKLEGYEDDWIYQGISPFIRYNKLPPGDYVLRVKGLDASGNRSKKELAIPLHIDQVFYKTWWFIALTIVLIALLIYVFFDMRMRQYQRMERLRNKISSDLHDDVGSLLSGLSMQTELMALKAEPEEQKKLTKIRSLSRQAVNQMRDLVWSIDARKEKLGDLIEKMHELAEGQLPEHDITFNIDCNETNLDRKLPPQTKQHLFLIFKEAMNNMLKHSNATHLEVIVSNTSKGAELRIYDNGTITTKIHGAGLGLSNMTSRVAQMKGNINFNTTKGFGIDISLPFNL